VNEQPGQRLTGLLLGLWFLVHQWLVVLPPVLGEALGGLFVVGLVLRLAGRLPPRWVAWGSLAVVAGIPFLAGMSPAGFFAGAAAWVAGSLLLRAMDARRALRVLLCAVTLLAVLALSTDIGSVPLIVDAAILLFLAQQSHTPEEATQSLRAVLLRALRLGVPVAAIVVPAFWIFPALSSRTEIALAGFSGELNPGDFSEIRPGRQLAFVARFSEDAPVPGVGELFWRGSVLDQNHGLRWLAGTARPARRDFGGLPAWHYALAIEPSRPVAPLGVSQGAGGVAAPADERLEIDVTSFEGPANDPPQPADVELPADVAGDPALRALAGRVFQGPGGTRQKLSALAEFFATSGFTYTMRPGRGGSVSTFLTKSRRGFCEHYAAASANLLRLGGIPARVITGYRGGRWNPWLRTLSVRDSDAHAWVEAWDPASASWLRFDATEAVAPDFLLQLATDRDPSRWTWPRRVITYASSLFVKGSEWISSTLRAGIVWAGVAAAALGGGLWFLARRSRRRDPVDEARAAMDRCAGRLGIPRAAGEPPLAWVARAAGRHPASAEVLANFAESYERAAYGRAGGSAANRLRLRAAVSGLRRVARSSSPRL